MRYPVIVLLTLLTFPLVGICGPTINIEKAKSDTLTIGGAPQIIQFIEPKEEKESVWEKNATLVLFISAMLTMLANTIMSYLQLQASTKNILTQARTNVGVTNRQQWIYDLRAAVGEFVAELDATANESTLKFLRLSKEGNLHLAKSKVILLLYPQGDAKDKELQTAVVAAFDAVRADTFNRDGFTKARDKVVTLTQQLLYDNWLKIKTLEDINFSRPQ
ncbi:MAG: hypothetical protein U0V74_16420 [Chitinophagales bacterium]